eukprot:14784438-Ditylum_brightwellii.AAC.2
MEKSRIFTSLHLHDMPISSQEIMYKEDCLEVKGLAIKEDGEVRASLRLCNKPISSQNIMCKEDCLEVKELAIKEDGE